MADTNRPTTPKAAAPVRNPITPEQVRRMEESRLRAKALRTQQEAAAATTSRAAAASSTLQSSGGQLAGQKRAHAAINTKDIPATSRDARIKSPSSNNGLAQSADTDIRAARKFQKFVEYDFSKMSDTKGGFMTQEDDPHNRALHAGEDGKPPNMSLKEWEYIQLQRKLQKQRAGPYEPGLSVFDQATAKKCRECKTLEIDWAWDEMLHCQICHSCKDKFPDKYSLLTKSEAREDYLLTDPELKDTELLPHLEKPNPHKASFAPMMLYLRYQVEEYAFSEQKWGSAEALDVEFERRKMEAKERKEKKFKNKLNELKKRTRVDAYKRARGGGGGEFGDTIGKGKHEHEWGRSVEDPETGMTRRKCIECGMQVEEMEF